MKTFKEFLLEASVDISSLGLSEFKYDGHTIKTGTSFNGVSLRNTQSAKNFGSRYQQDI